MKLESKVLTIVSSTFLAAAFTAAADSQPVMIQSPSSPPPDLSQDTHYGLFNWLDHRSTYGSGIFPEPFLVDDSDLEVNEFRVDWLYTKAHSDRADEVTAEIEKGFGPVTVEAEFHYERGLSDGHVVDGIGNIDLGARTPIHQFVSANGFVDNTFGVAFELGIPVHSSVSKNMEVVPKVFDDLCLGGHLTLQTILGYSVLLGPQPDGDTKTFEYGFDLGYTITRDQLPIRGVQQLIPIFELSGETALNKDAPGETSLLGNIGIRADLKPIHGIQPRLGVGFVFPMSNAAHEEVHYGFITSLVFEY